MFTLHGYITLQKIALQALNNEAFKLDPFIIFRKLKYANFFIVPCSL